MFKVQIISWEQDKIETRKRNLNGRGQFVTGDYKTATLVKNALEVDNVDSRLAVVVHTGCGSAAVDVHCITDTIRQLEDVRRQMAAQTVTFKRAE